MRAGPPNRPIERTNGRRFRGLCALPERNVSTEWTDHSEPPGSHGRPLSCHARVVPRVLCLLALALLATGCGVHDRGELVGRYALGAGEASWSLAADGTCLIERAGTREACEWVYREGPEGTRLVVTVPPGKSGIGTRYVLTPSKWPGQPVTIPLTDELTLEKVSAEPGPTR